MNLTLFSLHSLLWIRYPLFIAVFSLSLHTLFLIIHHLFSILTLRIQLRRSLQAASDSKQYPPLPTFRSEYNRISYCYYNLLFLLVVNGLLILIELTLLYFLLEEIL